MNKSVRKEVIRVYEEHVALREFDLQAEAEIEEVMPLPLEFKERIRKETVAYIQQTIQAQYSFDNEGTVEEKVEIAGVEGVRFVKHGEVTLIWCSYGYIFELNAPEQYVEEIINIAESIEMSE